MPSIEGRGYLDSDDRWCITLNDAVVDGMLPRSTPTLFEYLEGGATLNVPPSICPYSSIQEIC